MTTRTIPDCYQFAAKVVSKGKKRSGDGWTLTFDWKMPGSQYDYIMYDDRDTDLSSFNIDDYLGCTITRGRLKNDKTGQYNTDYFWDVLYVGDPEHQPRMADTPGVAVQSAASPNPSSGGGSQPQPPDDRGKQIAWNSAVNNAVTLCRTWDVGDEEKFQHIQLASERFYTMIVTGPPTPETTPEAPESDAQPPEPEQAPLGPVSAKQQILDAVNEYKPNIEALQDYIVAYYDGRKTDDLLPDEGLAIVAAIARGEIGAPPEEPDDLPF